MALPARSLVLPLIVLAIGIVLAGTAGWVALGPRANNATAVATSAIGGPFRLTTGDGRNVTEADYKGEPTLLFFGYTHCPDVCPTTLFEMSELLRKLGEKAPVHALFVTVDPERDSPAVMRDYVSSFDKRIEGLSGDPAAIGAMLKAYRVYSRKVPGEGADYSMDHSAVVYLMNKNMQFVNALNLDDPERAAKEIRALL
jgi:protein SCO1/2